MQHSLEGSLRIGHDGKSFDVQITLILFLAGVVCLCGCTSIGHEKRAAPKIAREVGPITEFGFDSDDNDLSVAVEKFLDSRGIRLKLLSTPQVRQQKGEKEYTYDEVQTRYVLKVRSTDLDTCIPEGSRQMHFDISVTDFQTRQRVLVMKGQYGCRDTIIKEFEKWLSGQHEPTATPSRQTSNRT
jgi:hypothetical protein